MDNKGEVHDNSTLKLTKDDCKNIAGLDKILPEDIAKKLGFGNADTGRVR